MDDRVIDRAVTWVHWAGKAGRPTEHNEIEMERLEELLDSGAWFARKFPPGANIGSYRLHQHGG